jgi:predicted DsbA family dithiol-disulfide isomerase
MPSSFSFANGAVLMGGVSQAAASQPPALCKVFEMAEGMKANFTAAGLPYAFTEKGLTGNTFNAHRLLTYAASHSLATQDKVAESLFRAYFAEEQFPNDPQVLLAAALEGGLEESGARSLIEDENAMAEETRGELLVAQRYPKLTPTPPHCNAHCNLNPCRYQVSGVPFFLLSEGEGEDVREISLSGAQPPARFIQALERIETQ